MTKAEQNVLEAVLNGDDDAQMCAAVEALRAERTAELLRRARPMIEEARGLYAQRQELQRQVTDLVGRIAKQTGSYNSEVWEAVRRTELKSE